MSFFGFGGGDTDEKQTEEQAAADKVAQELMEEVSVRPQSSRSWIQQKSLSMQNQDGDWEVPGASKRKKKKKKKKKKSKGAGQANTDGGDGGGGGGNDDGDDDDDDDFIERMAQSQVKETAYESQIRRLKSDDTETEVEANTRKQKEKEKIKKKMRKMEQERQSRLKDTMDAMNASERSIAASEAAAARGGEGKQEEEEADDDDDEAEAAAEPAKVTVRVQDTQSVQDLKKRMEALRNFCDKVADKSNATVASFVKQFKAGQGLIKKGKWGEAIEVWDAALAKTEDGKDIAPRWSCALRVALALMLKAVGETRASIQHFAYAFQRVRGEKDVPLRVYPLEQLAELYHSVGQVDQANKVLQIATGIVDEQQAAVRKAERNRQRQWLDAIVRAMKGDCAVLKKLVEAGEINKHVPVDFATPEDFTALMGAARNGDLDLVTALLEKGADLELEDVAGQTALVWACTYKHDALVKQLFRKKARCPPVESLPEESVSKWSTEIRTMYDKVALLYKKRDEKEQADAKKKQQEQKQQHQHQEKQKQKQKQAAKGKKAQGGRGEKYDKLKGFNAAPQSKEVKEGKLFGRELAAFDWTGGAEDDGGGGLEDDGSKAGGGGGGGGGGGKDDGKWDQFAANEQLFGVKSTYDENLYTTKLDKKKLTKEQEAEAQRIADAILGGDSDNLHVKEERGADMSAHSEEALYSAVLGSGGFSKEGKKTKEGTSAKKQVKKTKDTAGTDSFTDSGVNQKK